MNTEKLEQEILELKEKINGLTHNSQINSM